MGERRRFYVDGKDGIWEGRLMILMKERGFAGARFSNRLKRSRSQYTGVELALDSESMDDSPSHLF